MLLLLSSTTILLALGWGVYDTRLLSVSLLALTAILAGLHPRFKIPIQSRAGLFWAIAWVLYCAYWGYARGPAIDVKKLFVLLITIIALSPLIIRRNLWQTPVLLVAFFLTAMVYLRLPFPQIDLWYLQETAISLLGKGKSPYGLPYYAGVPLADTWVKSLPYPPGHLLSIWAGSILGDFRWVLVASHAAAAIVLWRLTKGAPRWARAIPIVFLFYPKAITYIWRSWTEPTLIAAMAGAIFAVVRQYRRLLILSLGFALCTKQFGFLFVGAFWLTRLITFRELLASAGIAGAICLPFILTDPIGTMQGTVLIHLKSPPRTDSWSIPALIHYWGGPQLSGLTPFVSIPVIAVLFRKARGLTESLCVASVFYLVFFLMSPKAHENYFFTPMFLTLAALLNYLKAQSITLTAGKKLPPRVFLDPS